MKKILTTIMALCLIAGIAGISYASVDNTYEVAVIDISGDVKVDTKADGTWITPWVGMKLMQKAVIKTGVNSSIDIVFDAEGLNILKIKENSLVSVEEASVDLPEGSVLANFGNLVAGSSFVVKTPTAACAIRGSGMGVDVFNSITSIQAFEHTVYVQGLDSSGNSVGREVQVPEGWKTMVQPGGTIQAPAELTANEVQVFNAWVEAVTGSPPPGGSEPGDTDTDDVDGKDLDEVKEEEGGSEISPSGSDNVQQEILNLIG